MFNKILFVVIGTILTGPLLACPVTLFSDEFKPALSKESRGGFQLYSLVPNESGKLAWKSQRLQIDFIDQDGDFVLPNGRAKEFEKKYQTYAKRGWGEFDRFSFLLEDFGAKRAKQALPCGAKSAYEVRPRRYNKYAYLMKCKDPLLASPPGALVKYNTDKRLVDTGYFKFSYDKRNHILFEKIEVKDGESYIETGSNANLRIRSDVKKFFTMNFGPNDIETKVNSYRSGINALVANVTFYLKILFFSIDLKLNSGMSFFGNTVHIPMILHMPIDAKKWLHPLSGAFYSWNIDPSVVKIDLENSNIPILEVGDLKKGIGHLAKKAKKYCRRINCTFSLTGTMGGQAFAMNFQLPKSLIRRGFYPLLSQQIDTDQKAMGWKIDEDLNYKNRLGVYFENSGLDKGNHSWEFWIKLGPKDAVQPGICPLPVGLKFLKS